jgi:hypothetical protein
VSRRGLGWYRIHGRSRTSLLVSVAVHAAVIGAMLNIVFRYEIAGIGAERSTRPAPERLRYVRVVAQPSAGGDSASAIRPAGPTATVRLRAPTRVPIGIPEPPRASAAAAPGVADRPGSPGGAGDVTAATGVQPAYTDPRLWPQPGPFIPLPKTAAQRLDSAVTAAFGIFVDSMATAEANRGRAPGDWTFTDKGGRKWGWDQGAIRLGKVMIPNAVLSLLPLNVQANPTFSDPVTVREAAFRRSDILYHAHRAVSEDEFRRAVRRIRERKDRERAAARAENANGDGPPPVATPREQQ